MSGEEVMRFRDKAVVIVGGSSGIGAATAKRLAREGARILVGDIDDAAAEAMLGAIGGDPSRLAATRCDIGREEEVEALFLHARKMFGRIDGVLVNAADVGIARHDSDALNVPLEIFDRTIAINLRGHVLATRHALPLLLESQGAIVYTSSRAGLTSEKNFVSYSISKAGLHALMRHVALAWGKQGVRANVIAPGTILTEALRQREQELVEGERLLDARLARTASPRLGTPEDMAAVIAFLLSDDAAFVQGQIIAADGGHTMR